MGTAGELVLFAKIGPLAVVAGTLGGVWWCGSVSENLQLPLRRSLPMPTWRNCFILIGCPPGRRSPKYGKAHAWSLHKDGYPSTLVTFQITAEK